MNLKHLRWPGAFLVLALLCWWWQAGRAPVASGPLPGPAAASPATKLALAPAPLTAEAAPAAARLARAGTPAGRNAADFYKDAISRLRAFSPEELAMLKTSPPTHADPVAERALFEKIQPIAELLRRAMAEATWCDWGMGPMRFDTPLPHLAPIMQLGQLARWDAEYRFPDDPAGAVEDLAAQAALARSMGGNNAMIGSLVEQSLLGMGTSTLSRNSDYLTPEALAQAAAIYDPASVTENATRALAQEAVALRNQIDQLDDPVKRQELQARLQDSGRAMPGDLGTLKASLQWVSDVEKAFAGKAVLPEAQFQAWWNSVKTQAAARPPAADFLPSLEGYRSRLQQSSVNQTMILAGLRVLQQGEAGLAGIADPTTGRPFTYVARESGFELQSPLVVKNKPVTMTFRWLAPASAGAR